VFYGLLNKESFSINPLKWKSQTHQRKVLKRIKSS